MTPTRPRSAHHDLLTQKRSGGAAGTHRKKSEKKKSKYRADWKSGRE